MLIVMDMLIIVQWWCCACCYCHFSPWSLSVDSGNGDVAHSCVVDFRVGGLLDGAPRLLIGARQLLDSRLLVKALGTDVSWLAVCSAVFSAIGLTAQRAFLLRVCHLWIGGGFNSTHSQMIYCDAMLLHSGCPTSFSSPVASVNVMRSLPKPTAFGNRDPDCCLFNELAGASVAFIIYLAMLKLIK